ncbi:autotransporter outer membrane beta-barrel domain-containing protein [Polynucleobacter sp. UK-Kesae-W10]|uniref:autotransporter outer membrane beta-barrel domain-containing protein n=1 Tax=Polynucleobacter sp. UK-Kesae-W10 TaxID=1819738 RepID=UPI001C0A9A4F|nr:autotransporter outer membrane beta-barrel domain-containing protein [Polynucleobacter sp. UK-Kesae-W10]MBU3577352.1 autotransporter outer membrane beta-barrel domain-containing protein [Polynucleobacter sp. UK-Kesae-W10]
MKLKNKILLVIQGFLIALLVGYANISTAAPCTPDSTSPSSDCSDLLINSNAGVLVNNYTISATGTFAVRDTAGGTFSLFTNNGTINSGTTAAVAIGTAVGNFVNNGTIRNGLPSAPVGSGGIAVGSGGSIVTLTNTGSITPTSGNGVQNLAGGSIDSIINSGVIGSGSTFGVANAGTIGTITNTGRISGAVEGIQNGGTIGVINNSNGSLFYNGRLPSSYNVIINSPSDYGQIRLQTGSGAMNFGIYAGSTVAKGTYASVLMSNFTSTNLNNLSGNYNGFTYKLIQNLSNWDLVVTGASTADTQQSLANTAKVLQGTYTIQNAALVNSFTYDCNEFGANNVCVSAGGRNTAVSAANGLNNTSALLIAAYRPHPNYRVGAYVDQNLSVNNAGSTVNLGNNTPLIGLFAAWNERLDGTGAEVKASTAYGQKNTTITRQVVGSSEAGSGSSQLNSQGIQLVGKYGFGVVKDVIVSPYAGIRYTQNNMGGYTEGASSSVTAPLTYSALNTNATTALAGVGASYQFIPQALVFASAGVETDTNTSNGTYSATGIAGLAPVNFNANLVKTRATAMLGAAYDVVKNQRLAITGIYRQEPYQAMQTTTVMATYTIGL